MADERDVETGSDPAAQMREHWRRFARDDAKFYIATNRDDWSDEGFYAHGAAQADEVLSWSGDIERTRMLEVGCGTGRMLKRFAEQFARVDGIDIASEMIDVARAADLGSNVSLTVGTGSDLDPYPDSCFDLVLCAAVFQHIPVRSVVASYLSEIARVLRPRGRAVLYFDSREETVARKLLLRLPDPLLPRTRRRYIRRYPLPSAWIEASLTGAGLRVVDERAPDSGEHRVLCRRT